jgi:hypothetical protein
MIHRPEQRAVLVLAAITVLFTRKVKGAGGPAH